MTNPWKSLCHPQWKYVLRTLTGHYCLSGWRSWERPVSWRGSGANINWSRQQLSLIISLTLSSHHCVGMSGWWDRTSRFQQSPGNISHLLAGDRVGWTRPLSWIHSQSKLQNSEQIYIFFFRPFLYEDGIFCTMQSQSIPPSLSFLKTLNINILILDDITLNKTLHRQYLILHTYKKLQK